MYSYQDHQYLLIFIVNVFIVNIMFRIDHQGIIKVSDFGLSKSLYEKMYFRQDKSDGVKLPIKWMAIESIDDGIFSEKTDVVN